MLLAALALGAGSPLAQAEPARAHKVGVLSLSTKQSLFGDGYARFVAELAQRGYVAGRDIELVERSDVADVEMLHRYAREIVAAQPAVIVTEGTPCTVALQRLTKTIPIVTDVGDPVGAGFARSLARPGGNITGVSQNRAQLAVKQVELLRTLVPGLREIGVIYESYRPGVQTFIPPVADAARAFSIAMREIPVAEDATAEGIKSCAERGIRAAISLSGADTKAGQTALRHRVAVIVPGESDVGEGIVASLESDGSDYAVEIAAMVDKILRGAAPGSLPFSVATRYRIVINARAIAKLGLKVPKEVLMTADRVIE